MPSYPLLFSPLTIGTVKLKNRIVMPAMATNATTDGAASQQIVDYFVERARGRTGLIITEAASVMVPPQGKFARFHLNISDDRFIPSLKRLTDAVHVHGTKIAIQLSHLGRQIHAAFWGEQPVAPSSIACPVCRDLPKELTIEEIKLIIHAFVEASRRAQEAGFDMVELHGCHGYLIGNFFSRRSNIRTDLYGGDAMGRSRFCKEIIRGIKEASESPLPVIVRMNGHDYIKDGETLEDMQEIAPLLEEAGADALHVTAGVYGSYKATVAPMYEKEGCFIDLAEGIRKVVSIPVIAVGRIINPSMAEETIRTGKADLVAMGRALIADPNMPLKAMSSKSEDICACTGCNQGCIDQINNSMMAGRTEPVTCLVNPRVLREAELTVDRTNTPRNILVLGGGPAGLEAALTAARRGHDVVLWEKEPALGGQFKLAGTPPGRESFTDYIRYMDRQIAKAGVQVMLNREATADALSKLSPNAIIYALGASPIIPSFTRGKSADTTTAWSVLRGNIPDGRRIAVIGGGAVGLETAHYMAGKGKEITVLEATGTLGSDMGAIVSFYLRNILKQAGVNILRNTVVQDIFHGKIVVLQEGKERLLNGFDAIVLALGARSNDTLVEDLRRIIPEIHVIGDARKPRKALEAIAEGFEIGIRI